MKKKRLLIMPFFLASVLIFILNSCQTNVGLITSTIKYDITGYVLDSETSAGIEGATMYFNGESLMLTDTAGKYTINNLKPGDYLIMAKKSGYTQGRYNITVSNNGVIARAITLKKLAPSVSIGPSGGSVVATNSSGNPIAELSVSVGELSEIKQISVTNLTGTEVPKILETSNKLLGTTVSLNTDDSNISFTNGAKLTFKLPFRHKPGDAVAVDYFNETTNTWDAYQNAIVNKDGLTASVDIHHFSTYSATIDGSYSETPDENIGYEIIGNSDNYEKAYKWSSSLEYRNNVTDSIDHEWLYKTVESQTNLNFSTVSYGSSNAKMMVASSPDVIIRNVENRSTITAPSNQNPEKYRHLPYRHWELVRFCCWVHEIVAAQVFIAQYGGYITQSIPNWYQVCTYIWIWRPSDSDSIPVKCSLNPEIIIIIGPKHDAGTID